MIVRILEEGQFELDQAKAEELDRLDHPLEDALQAGDGEAFTLALERVESWVRTNGTPLDPATIVPSDVVLPAPGSELSEIQALLESEGKGV
ncbi:MAG TPA: hypothetical protein VG368_04845 [Acidimicrobiales bacterium]|nr:hypothetical protein [Acidimicrobiales bacterium]